jgi:hypothetical protein
VFQTHDRLDGVLPLLGDALYFASTMGVNGRHFGVTRVEQYRRPGKDTPPRSDLPKDSTGFKWSWTHCGVFFAFARRALAAARPAFRARAERCSAVMVCSDRFPPMRPPLAPCSLKNLRTSAGSFFTVGVILPPLWSRNADPCHLKGVEIY